MLLPSLGVSSLDLGRPSGRPLFLEVRRVHFRAARRCLMGIGPGGCGQPNAPLGAAACGSYLSHSESRADRQRLAGGLMPLQAELEASWPREGEPLILRLAQLQNRM